MRTTLAFLALAVAAGNVSAQALQGTVEGSVVAARVRTRVQTGPVELTGPLFGGHGTLSLGRLLLDVAYLQGKVNPDRGNASSRDFVEGRALLGFRPLPWLALKAGPHARTYGFTSGSGTQRWLFWELRARAEGMFIGSTVRGYAELWRAVSADVPESFDYAQGGEAGMIVRLARLPLEARIAYRIEHAALGGGSRLETVEGVVAGVVLKRH
jgi:hypothetical protein